MRRLARSKQSEMPTDLAFHNLVGEALSLCLAADPQLGGALARLLNMEQMSVAAGHALQPTVALRTCLHMLTYAQVEAHERVDLFHWTAKLDLCIEQLADRLEPGQGCGFARPRLHS
jgi:hypothetical protein